MRAIGMILPDLLRALADEIEVAATSENGAAQLIEAGEHRSLECSTRPSPVGGDHGNGNGKEAPAEAGAVAWEVSPTCGSRVPTGRRALNVTVLRIRLAVEA